MHLAKISTDLVLKLLRLFGTETGEDINLQGPRQIPGHQISKTDLGLNNLITRFVFPQTSGPIFCGLAGALILFDVTHSHP